MDDYIINLAAGLTYDLMKLSGRRLSVLTLGTAEERALARAYESAFNSMLYMFGDRLQRDELHLVCSILQEFIRQPGVADALMDVGLRGTQPDLSWLLLAFERLFDNDSLTGALDIDFTEAITHFHRGLSQALVTEARSQGSVLFNSVSLGRILTIQTLLEQQTSSLDSVVERVKRLEEAGGEAVYDKIVDHATGTTRKDSGAVHQVLSNDMRILLQDVLEGLTRAEVQDLPLYTNQDLRIYLQNIIDLNQSLDTRGLGGPVDRLPLERVYTPLRAETLFTTKRSAKVQQWLTKLENKLKERNISNVRRLKILRRAVARRDPTYPRPNQAISTSKDSYIKDQNVPFVSGLEHILANCRWTVLLGDPGSGKTTVLRWISLQFARALLEEREEVIVGTSERFWLTDSRRGLERLSSINELRALTEEPRVLGPTRLPVPIRLADYAQARWVHDYDTSLTLFEYIGRHPWRGRALHPVAEVGAALVHDFIHNKKALILLDGLDEIADDTRRGSVVDAIIHFIQQHVRTPESNLCAVDDPFDRSLLSPSDEPQTAGGNQVIVTSRRVGYLISPLPRHLPHYSIQPLSSDAIMWFCLMWTHAVNTATGQEDTQEDYARLWEMFHKPRANQMVDLARNPLLLTIIVGLYFDLDGQLPERRIQLYERVVEGYLNQRHDKWLADGITLDTYKYAMGYVAVRLHENTDYPNGIADESQIVEWLEESLARFHGTYSPKLGAQARYMLRTARDVGGFLLEMGNGVYGFIHRSFQEYFAALYLAWDKASVTQEVLSRLRRSAWREILTLTLAEVSQRHPQFFGQLLEAVLAGQQATPGRLPLNALFLAKCLPEFVKLPPVAIQQEICYRHLVAYSDRVWPPSNTSYPSEDVMTTVHDSLFGLYSLPAYQYGMSKGLRSPNPAERMVAADVAAAAPHAGLVRPLVECAVSEIEPAAMVRLDLIRHHRHYRSAFTTTRLPIRRLLKDPTVASRMWERDVWRATLIALYVNPERKEIGPPSATDIIFDSALTPMLIKAWQENRSENEVLSLLTTQAQDLGGGSATRDAHWVLAIADNTRWHAILNECSFSRELLRAIYAGIHFLASLYAQEFVKVSYSSNDLQSSPGHDYLVLSVTLDLNFDTYRAMMPARADFRSHRLARTLDRDVRLSRAFADRFQLPDVEAILKRYLVRLKEALAALGEDGVPERRKQALYMAQFYLDIIYSLLLTPGYRDLLETIRAHPDGSN